ncbi:ceramide kinase-like [Mya arenaria]|uniref:ceramide kinase-like n=1 Tax=Mya arenaria TaxID=6604 RepID=UPI0022E407D9|nr:ceramide kinase-like [Mya arenaria]
MADNENCLFTSSVEHQNKQHILTLTKFTLIWELSNKSKVPDNNLFDPLLRHDACIDLREIIGVKAIKIPTKSSTLSLRKSFKVDENAPFFIEMQPLGPLGFSVVVLSQPGNHKWRYKQVSFQCKDSNLCHQWITAVKEALKNPIFNRPQKLVVFVNPFSGKKKAVKLYREKVLPLFELADIDVTLIETERQNHAKDLVQDSLDLNNVDGLVCVGGDGMFSEILNGLLTRTARENGIEETGRFEPVPPDIRIGIIPAGSTNTIVHTTTGGSDVVTSTLHIILGDKIGIDVNSVNVNNQFIRYSVTMLGYGYMGDLLKDSDNIRWMGPKRYSWSGTKSFLSNNSYYGEIKYRLSENPDSHPTDEVKCYTGCDTCSQAGEGTSGMSRNSSGVEFTAGGELTPIDECSISDKSLSVSEYSTSDPNWRTVVGKFVAVNSVTMSCSCDLSPPGMSPYCHLGDGCLDLILVSDCSRLDFLKFLMRTAKGEERHNLDFIQMYRVKEFTFRPLTEDEDLESLASTEDLTTHRKRVKLKRQTSKTSVWNCDGEVIDQAKISVRVHCQLINLFARGVEDLNTSEDQKCKTCCTPTFDRL